MGLHSPGVDLGGTIRLIRMRDSKSVVQAVASEIESALWNVDRQGSAEAAESVYADSIRRLELLGTDPDPAGEAERSRVLAYGYMRFANLLRQSGRVAEAVSADEKGLEAALVADDSVSIGQLLLSIAGTSLAAGEIERGERTLDEAISVFSVDTTPELRQGLGWALILKADAANAGLSNLHADELFTICDEALEILESIENWPGVARAHMAKAIAFDRLGNGDAADVERRLGEEFDHRSDVSDDL